MEFDVLYKINRYDSTVHHTNRFAADLKDAKDQAIDWAKHEGNVTLISVTSHDSYLD